MAPLAGLGAGAFIKTVAPSAKVLSFLGKTKNANIEKVLPQKMSPTAKGLQDDIAKVRQQYKNAEEVKVCGINVGEYMCRDNIQELLKFAKQKYPDFNLSKAKVLRIDAPEEIPLYVNKATKPNGYSSPTMNGVKDFSKKVRTKKDGSTTWSRHYILEYEGRIYDFDHASDLAPATKDYIETMFSDTLSGVVKNDARSKYLVRTIDADEYLNAESTSVFDIRGPRLPSQEYFFDFYKRQPGAKTDIKSPVIHPDIENFPSKSP
jgi:hypothetical protein